MELDLTTGQPGFGDDLRGDRCETTTDEATLEPVAGYADPIRRATRTDPVVAIGRQVAAHGIPEA